MIWLRAGARPTPRRRALMMALIELAIGLSAIPGGIGLIRDGMGMRSGWIDHSLLEGWQVPGVLLLVVIGGGMVSAAVIGLRSPLWASPAAMAMGVVLIVWLSVETLVIGWHGGPQVPLDAISVGAAAGLIGLSAPQLRLARDVTAGVVRENAYSDDRETPPRFRVHADAAATAAAETEHSSSERNRNGTEGAHHAQSS